MLQPRILPAFVWASRSPKASLSLLSSFRHARRVPRSTRGEKLQQNPKSAIQRRHINESDAKMLDTNKTITTIVGRLQWPLNARDSELALAHVCRHQNHLSAPRTLTSRQMMSACARHKSAGEIGIVSRDAGNEWISIGPKPARAEPGASGRCTGPSGVQFSTGGQTSTDPADLPPILS